MRQRAVVRITIEPRTAQRPFPWEAYDRFVSALHGYGIRVEDYDYWPDAWDE